MFQSIMFYKICTASDFCPLYKINGNQYKYGVNKTVMLTTICMGFPPISFYAIFNVILKKYV